MEQVAKAATGLVDMMIEKAETAPGKNSCLGMPSFHHRNGQRLVISRDFWPPDSDLRSASLLLFTDTCRLPALLGDAEMLAVPHSLMCFEKSSSISSSDFVSEPRNHGNYPLAPPQFDDNEL